MSELDEAVSRHEAGHAAVAQWLGWRSRGLTVDPGTYSLGCARYAPPELPESAWDGFDLYAPFALWSPLVRGHIEAEVLCLLAGGLAERLLAPPRVGREVPSVAEQAAEQVEALAALPDPAPADVAVIRKIVARRADIERLAAVAAVRKTLSGEQVAACLRE